MSLKREMLVEAGIEDKAVIDNIMQAYGAGVEMPSHKPSRNCKPKTTH